MATIRGGVVERSNTIEENKQVLSEIIRKNEYVEPSHKELDKLLARLNAENASELVKDMKCHEPAWQNKKVTNRLYGPVPGIPCGSWWGIRMDCSRDRMHDPFSAGVQCGPVGAVSVCTSHSNEDVDLGDMLTLTGQSLTEEDGCAGRLGLEKEQDYVNKSLILSCENRVPVRIIRSYDLSNEYSPSTGYRYDGLYMVIDYWIGISLQSDTRCYKFAFKRLCHQEPPPWKLELSRHRVELVPAPKRLSKNWNSLKTNNVSANTNDTITSQLISMKRHQTRDGKMPKAVKTARKRRSRLTESSSEAVETLSTLNVQGLPSTMIQFLPGRKIVSTDHKNVHVSTIVTRRVSKKLSNNGSDIKLLADCRVNKAQNISSSELQTLGNDGEAEGCKSQSTRLQNTNISIRTDLYESSHNLKHHVKKCGPSTTHSQGMFKPRVLAVPRRELNFAGVDSSPGSSRTISSVKMERVKSIDIQKNQKSLDHISCQEKKKAVNPANMNILPKTPQSSIANTDTLVQRDQTARDRDIVMCSPSHRPFSSLIINDDNKHRNLEDSENLKTRCLHRMEHSYASQSPKSLTREGNCQNLITRVMNHEEREKETSKVGFRNPKGEQEIESLEPEAAQSSMCAAKKPELKKLGEKSLEISLSGRSPSQSPLFRGFRSPDRSTSEAEDTWRKSVKIINSLTLEKMLDIITEEKSSPIAKMLISNVIGFPAIGSSQVFNQTNKSDAYIENIESTIVCETEEPPLTMRMQSRKQQAAANSGNPDISCSVDHQNLGKSDSRHSNCFENSRQQKIIEIVHVEKEPEDVKRSVDTSSNSLTFENQLSVISTKSDKNNVLTSDKSSIFETRSQARASTKKSNENLLAVRQSNITETHRAEYSITRSNIYHKSQSKEKEKDGAFLWLHDNPGIDKDRSSLKTKVQVSREKDCVDFWNNKPIEGVIEHCNSSKGIEQARTRLTIARGKKDTNSWKQSNLFLDTEELLEPDFLGFPKSSASQTTNEKPIAHITTRSKCLQNFIRGSNSNLETLSQRVTAPNLKLSIVHNESPDLNQNLELHGDEQISDEGVGRIRKSENKVGNNQSEIITVLKSGDLPTDHAPRRGGRKFKSEGAHVLSKDKSSEKMRLTKRSGVRVRHKMEIANLFIDMNMTSQSQMLKSKLRARTSLQSMDHSRRSSCPAAVDRAMKRRNDNPVKHPTSQLKRLKKSIQVKSSSVQVSSAANTRKGLSLRKRTRNHASPLSNNNNDNNSSNNNRNSMKTIGKAEKVITKINKPIKSSVRNLVAKKNTVNGLRAAAELPRRRETVMRTRSGRSPRSRTVGRIGLRRALLQGTETYGRKKKKKKEKQMQIPEKVTKQNQIPAKHPPPKKEMIEFALNKAKLDYSIYKDARHAKPPNMVSVMTQCSLISIPPRCSACLVTNSQNKANNEENLCRNRRFSRGSDSSSECISSSNYSGMNAIKNEIIEVIEIKSESFDDDVASSHEDYNEAEEIRVQADSNSAFDQAAILPKNYHTKQTLDRSYIEGMRIHGTSSLQGISESLSTLNTQGSVDLVPRRGFIPYVAEHKQSAFAPIRSVEDNMRIAQLKSIGFKPIKPGVFPPDGIEEGSDYGRRSTSDSPKIAYSSAVLKRGVHEEYDKYTSEENNIVQYMDSKLCYEDIENEDILWGNYSEPGSNDMFTEKMEFVKMGNELDEESNDYSMLLRGDEGEEEVAEAEDLDKGDMKEWESQLDGNSSNMENDEQAVVDSDSDVPWHGWRKITSDGETFFVGW